MGLAAHGFLFYGSMYISLTPGQDRHSDCVEGIEMCGLHGCHAEGDMFKGQKVRLLKDEVIHLKIPQFPSVNPPRGPLFFSYSKELPSFKCFLPW